MENFYKKLSLLLKEVIAENYNLSLSGPVWESPSRQKFGDLSTAVSLKIASQTGRDSFEVAQEIKKQLGKKIQDEIERIEIIRPGFINLFFSKKFLIESLTNIIKKGRQYFKKSKGKKILIEFVSANPTGPLSVAHGRQAVVGDVLANIGKALGDKVEREYYLNDIGGQIELLVLSVAERAKQIKGENYSLPEGGYKGQYVKNIASEYLKRGQKESLEIFCLNYIKFLIEKDLKNLNIIFDNWISQKKLIEKGKVRKIIEILKKKKFLYEKEDALWFNSTKFSDNKDRVIKKSDGQLTYFASDIAYHNDKFQRGYHRLINLWGPDHHGYIERVNSALKALGFDNALLSIVIIQLVTLKTKERMSKRAGTMVLLSDLIREVGKDAARFYYLTRKNSSLLDFDIDLAKKSSFDNPLYYIQYVCARIASIFRKTEPDLSENFSNYLASREELEMVRLIIQFPFHLQKSYDLLEPVFLVEYLRNLAALFHKFYEKVRVIGDDLNKTQARLNLLWATKEVLHFGLEILGIQPLEKM